MFVDSQRINQLLLYLFLKFNDQILSCQLYRRSRMYFRFLIKTILLRVIRKNNNLKGSTTTTTIVSPVARTRMIDMDANNAIDQAIVRNLLVQVY
jgi:hypothetical protein